VTALTGFQFAIVRRRAGMCWVGALTPQRTSREFKASVCWRVKIQRLRAITLWVDQA
jgi:hypothetical protein